METLGDKFGVWCANCLEYLAGNAGENHHLLSTGQMDKLEIPILRSRKSTRQTKTAYRANYFQFIPPILDATVRVHKDTCHRKYLQLYADAAAHRLREVFHADEDQLTKIAHDLFYRGNHSQAVAYQLALANKAAEHEDRQAVAHHLGLATVSSAGVAKGSDLIEKLDESVFSGEREGHIFYLLGRGNLERNACGSKDPAREHYRRAKDLIEQLPEPKRRKLEAGLKRRAVTIDPSVKKANEALLATGENAIYEGRTARLNLGWTYFVDGDFGEARDCFNEVLTANAHRAASWWHIAEANFGLGLAQYLLHGRSNLGVSLRPLTVSQYVSALLGLRHDLIIGVTRRFPGLSAPLTSTQAIHIIQSQNTKLVSKKEMTDLRRSAVNRSLQLDLFQEIRGDMNTVSKR